MAKWFAVRRCSGDMIMKQKTDIKVHDPNRFYFYNPGLVTTKNNPRQYTAMCIALFQNNGLQSRNNKTQFVNNKHSRTHTKTHTITSSE